jgi:hypothetical protein
MAEENITFSYGGSYKDENQTQTRYYHYKDKNPIEWLQYFANTLWELADLWDDFDSDYIEEWIEDYKKDEPNLSKIEMYEQISDIICEGPLHAYAWDIEDTVYEIEHLRESILKAFEDSVILPNILNAIGIIESVVNIAKEKEDDFAYYHYYCWVDSPEIVRKCWGEHAVKRYKKNPKISIEDYESAFECVTELLEIIEKGEFSPKLRESSWAMIGYCKLKAESPEKFEEIQAEIANKKKKTSKRIPSESKSPPLSLKEMAGYFGKSTTVPKINTMIRNGSIEVEKIHRQSYYFNLDTLPKYVREKIEQDNT